MQRAFFPPFSFSFFQVLISRNYLGCVTLLCGGPRRWLPRVARTVPDIYKTGKEVSVPPLARDPSVSRAMGIPAVHPGAPSGIVNSRKTTSVLHNTSIKE